MTTGTRSRLAAIVLATSAVACGGSTGNGTSDTLGNGGYGVPTAGFYAGPGGNGGQGGNGVLGTSGAGGDAVICPAGLPTVGGSDGTSDASDASVGGDGGGPPLPPGVYCDNTNGNGNDDGGLAGEWVCPVASDPIWPAVLPDGTTAVGVFPRFLCPTSLPAIDATFLWTSENPVCHTIGGTFADPTAGSTTFTCKTAGDVNLFVYVGLRNTTCGYLGSTFTVHCHL